MPFVRQLQQPQPAYKLLTSPHLAADWKDGDEAELLEVMASHQELLDTAESVRAYADQIHERLPDGLVRLLLQTRNASSCLQACILAHGMFASRHDHVPLRQQSAHLQIQCRSPGACMCTTNSSCRMLTLQCCLSRAGRMGQSAPI